MKQTRQQLALLVVTTLSVCVLAAVPAMAEHGSDGSSGSGSGSDSSTSGGTSGSDGGTDTANIAPKGGTSGGSHDNGTDDQNGTGDTSDAATHTALDKLRTEGSTELTSERQHKGKQSTAEERQQSCKAHQAEITAKIQKYSNNAHAHLATFDGILAKVEAFYTSKQLSATNYSSLLAAATSQGDAAKQAVDALGSLSVTFDCTQADPAQGLATVKAAVGNARTALQAYRSAIKDLVTAIKTASTANEQTAGGTQ